MLCVIDIGNTNIVAAFMTGPDSVVFSARIVTERDKTEEMFEEEILNVFSEAGYEPGDIEGAIISSVVPEITDVVKNVMEKIAGDEVGKTVEIAGCDNCCDLEFEMDNPERVGCDLIVDGVAAISEYGDETIAIFDMGTATTCSVIDRKKYIGTIIIPGVKISCDALSEKASRLPEIDLKEPGRLLGKNTVESMLSGIVYGNAAMLDGLVQRLRNELNKDVRVLVTGGIGKLIVPYCNEKMELEENLLLKGLWYIYKGER